MVFPSVVVATLAPLLNAIQLVPQVHHTMRLKNVSHISLYSLVLIILVDVLWIIHGVFIDDYPLIVAGIANTMIALVLMGLYFRYQ